MPLNCPKCGKECSGFRFCPFCGCDTSVSMVRCPTCQMEIPGNSVYCPECGVDLCTRFQRNFEDGTREEVVYRKTPGEIALLAEQKKAKRVMLVFLVVLIAVAAAFDITTRFLGRR